MSEAGEGGEKEKKGKSGLVRLNRGGASPLTTSANIKLGGSTLSRNSTSLLSPLNRSCGVQSFKPKRDLTLGGGKASNTPIKSIASSIKPLERKKFVPNLNVTRQVKKENNGLSIGAGREGTGKRRKEKKFERKEKNSRDRPSLIQTDSIFSEGVGGDPLRRRPGGVNYRDDCGGGSETSALIKPKLELGKPCDRAEEDRKLKLILNDDFIDDLKHGSFLPVQLPMIDSGKMLKPEIKLEGKETDDIKFRLLNKKVSELDSDDDFEPAQITDEPQQPPPPLIQQQTPCDHFALPLVAQILKEAGSTLIFFQLPDNLPLRMSADVAQTTDGTLTGVEGRLGEIHIRKSGAGQLVLGNIEHEKIRQRFDIEAGTQVGFLQDLVSIRVPPIAEQDGEMTVLGHITNRLIVSPNWDSLLQDSGFDRDLA